MPSDVLSPSSLRRKLQKLKREATVQALGAANFKFHPPLDSGDTFKDTDRFGNSNSSNTPNKKKSCRSRLRIQSAAKKLLNLMAAEDPVAKQTPMAACNTESNSNKPRAKQPTIYGPSKKFIAAIGARSKRKNSASGGSKSQKKSDKAHGFSDSNLAN